jgi:hypothetical protein
VKAFTDTLLDLTVDTPETRSNVVDLLGRQELLYLGPDEQVTVNAVTVISVTVIPVTAVFETVLLLDVHCTGTTACAG